MNMAGAQLACEVDEAMEIVKHTPLWPYTPPFHSETACGHGLHPHRSVSRRLRPKVLGKRAYIVINDITNTVRPLRESFNDNPAYETDMFYNSGIEAISLRGLNLKALIKILKNLRHHLTG